MNIIYKHIRLDNKFDNIFIVITLCGWIQFSVVHHSTNLLYNWQKPQESQEMHYWLSGKIPNCFLHYRLYEEITISFQYWVKCPTKGSGDGFLIMNGIIIQWTLNSAAATDTALLFWELFTIKDVYAVSHSDDFKYSILDNIPSSCQRVFTVNYIKCIGERFSMSPLKFKYFYLIWSSLPAESK